MQIPFSDRDLVLRGNGFRSNSPDFLIFDAVGGLKWRLGT